MPQQPNVSIENNFLGGLKTEFTGLNFPENACTSTDNCVFTLIGDVLRREGFDFEDNFLNTTLDRNNRAISSYKWNNAGGDGSTQYYVLQLGAILYFYKASSATVSTPLSTKLLNVLDISGFAPASLDASLECQYADGNGYLFVFHPNCNPVYVTINNNILTANKIDLNIRDVFGISEVIAVNSRPVSSPTDHTYNLINQGWNITFVNAFFTALGVYPSNADIWYLFKNSSGAFDPATMDAKVILTSQAPRGSVIFNVFNQDRTSATGYVLPSITTNARPRTGAWFQGRVWYAGIDAFSTVGSPEFPYFTWTENIYFSQIVEDPSQFGKCYQVNDPANENFFDLLPTDGGTIRIQGCGSIYKLFPLQSGLLVFAANGIWYVTGSSGIGFTANDYSVSKISSVQSTSGASFVNVLGYPMFWNEEGVYYVRPSKEGGSVHSPDISLDVENICLGSILSFYAGIPLQSKRYARGDYHPIDFTVQWIYRSTNESSINTRYEFDKVLTFNTANKAFYLYTLPAGTPHIHDVRYIAGPGGSTSPDPVFKYLTSVASGGSYLFTFSEEKDSTNWVDFHSFNGVGINYVSSFVTGYKLHGRAQKKFQPQYIYMFSRNDVPNGYKIQGVWDYAITGDSNKTSSIQLVDNVNPPFGMIFRRHRIRGHGLVLQLAVSSVDGKPFDIMGWSIYETINQGV